LSLRQIAELEGVSYSKVYRLLKRYEIPLRSPEEGRLLRRKKIHGRSSYMDIDEGFTDELLEDFIESLQRQEEARR